METEADMTAEPDAMDTGMEGIVAEHSATVTVTDPEVGPENAVGGPQPDSDAMETENVSVNVTAEGGGDAELAAPAR